MSKENVNQLVLIQYLRAVAALMVVIHHAREPQEWLYNPLEFYPAFAWGVDIFFVISGFIMYVAAINEKPGEFVKKRLIRVIPLYWVATLMLLVILTKFHPFSINTTELIHLIKSFFFIPHYSPTHPGKIYPYLIAGWTLNYEMFFYAIFFVGLIWKRTALLLTSIIVFLVVLGVILEPYNAIIKTYTHPILLEFLGGFWVGYCYKNKIIKFNQSLVMIFGFIGLFSLPFLQLGDYLIFARVACSLLIIVGAVSLSRTSLHSSFLNLLGDASYSIYLTHSVVSLRAAYHLWHSVPITGMLQFATWTLLTLSISIIVGVGVYLYIEKPFLAWLRQKIQSKKLIKIKT